MVYIIFFVLCFICDTAKIKDSIIEKILILSSCIFLCFGYMTGSDWRNYELEYNYIETFTDVLNNSREIGLYFLFYIGHFLEMDFWLFSGLVKSFYLYSLLYFFSAFTDKKMSALGISFAYSTLFMLIDCPMRFMAGFSLLLISVPFYLKQNYFIALFLALLSFTFHITLILPFIMVLLIRYSHKFFTINRFILLITYILFFFISLRGGIIMELLGKVYSLELFKRFDGYYSDINTSNILSFGILKSFFFLCILLFYRNVFSSKKYGEVLYLMSYISMIMSFIVVAIPTGFRINILNGYFMVVALLFIIQYVYEQGQFKAILLNMVIIFIISVTFLRLIYNGSSYLPYSNSIPYILSEHLPYTYRTSYNFLENFNSVKK